MVKTVCLNMIVKNESHIITDTLVKLLEKITFDYYVICDTGSTDNTIELIKQFFKSKNICGELLSHEWKDFGHNRTLALEAAFKKSDYVFIFDADDSIEGNFILPELTLDGYMLKFGNQSSAYERMCLVKNDIIWKYVGVLHEYITSDQFINKGSVTGDYYIVSGRTSSRNNDPDKYLKDAIILENAYAEALKKNDPITNRYVYYCANSYLDAGKKDLAIEWYKRTLKSNGWFDERYNSCLKLYDLTADKSYLVESFYHNQRRVEGIFYLIRHYTCEDKYIIAYSYYKWIQNYFENEPDDLSTKLFANVMDYTFYLPYYMIIVCEKVKDYQTGLKMYSIIFEKKVVPPNQWWINNLVYNYQFYIQLVEDFEPVRNYFHFIEKHNFKIDKKTIKLFEKHNFFYNGKTSIINNLKTILIYTGFSKFPWNITFSKSNALGGSERAVIYLAEELSKKYNIIISGDMINETIEMENSFIQCISRFELNQLEIVYKTVIVSRYVSFFTLYPNIKYEKLVMMAHDTHFMNNLTGCEKSVESILQENQHQIDKIVCLTNWHASEYKKLYPNFDIHIINNGINPKLFPKNVKIPDSFVFTSCSSRGLARLIELWKSIIEHMGNATLHISSYQTFPKDEDQLIVTEMAKYKSITHYGKLNQEELYTLTSKMEYWLYPCTFNETSCITALEMLMSEVVCLYYPIAGLTDTLGEYGIQISKDNEIDTLLSLNYKQKNELRKKGKEYAERCSWENRALEWAKLIEGKITVFFAPGYFADELLAEYIISLKLNWKIVYTKDYSFIVKEKYRIEEIIIVHELPSEEIFDLGIDISYLNTEPLNLFCRLSYVLYDINNKYPIKLFYDYSLSNIHILFENGIKNTKHIPYVYNPPEINFLKSQRLLNNFEYDIGIICSSGKFTNNIEHLKPPRRKELVSYLISKGIRINIIQGFNKQRDIELAKCKCILNIHGSYIDEPSMIFEHIRCDRLLMAGYSILSETSLHISETFTFTYPKLSFMDYRDFFNIKKCYCFIHSCNIGSTKRLENLLKKLPKFFEKIFINNIGTPLEMQFEDNVELTEYSNDCMLYEIPTLNKINYFSKKNPGTNILYIHTKGVSYPDDYHEESDWIDMMLHFLFDVKCLYLLNTFDTLGCNYTTDGYNYSKDGYKTTLAPAHYSGNFWWAQSDYLKNLEKIPEENVNKNDGEYWLMKQNPKYYELHKSGINHFKKRYTPEMYL